MVLIAVILMSDSQAQAASLLNHLVTWKGKDGDTWEEGTILSGILDVFHEGDVINFNGTSSSGGNIFIGPVTPVPGNIVTAGVYFSGNNDYIFHNNGIRTTNDPLLTTLFSILNTSVNGKLNLGAAATAPGSISNPERTGNTWRASRCHSSKRSVKQQCHTACDDLQRQPQHDLEWRKRELGLCP